MAKALVLPAAGARLNQVGQGTPSAVEVGGSAGGRLGPTPHPQWGKSVTAGEPHAGDTCVLSPFPPTAIAEMPAKMDR